MVSSGSGDDRVSDSDHCHGLFSRFNPWFPSWVVRFTGWAFFVPLFNLAVVEEGLEASSVPRLGLPSRSTRVDGYGHRRSSGRKVREPVPPPHTLDRTTHPVVVPTGVSGEVVVDGPYPSLAFPRSFSLGSVPPVTT